MRVSASALLVVAAILTGTAKTLGTARTARDTTDVADVCTMPSPAATITSTWTAAYPTFDEPCLPQNAVAPRPIRSRAAVPGDWSTGYMATCRNCSLRVTDPREHRDTLLSCMCLNGHPQCQDSMNIAEYVESVLDLNAHFGNDQGHLTFGDRNFLYTCEACNLTCGYWYFCECSYGDGTHFSDINLDLYFWAPYGTLQRRPTSNLPPKAVVPSLDAADPEGQGRPPVFPDGPDGTWKLKHVRRSVSGPWLTLAAATITPLVAAMLAESSPTSVSSPNSSV
ncbi:hypothetical protein RB595_006833 [Gaeumannomyces hyphopodioides]